MKKNTYFFDIDGTIFKYRQFDLIPKTKPEVIESTRKQLKKWYNEGHHIIICTARPYDLKIHTLVELQDNDIPYHQIIMGLERGPRYIVNDMDPAKEGKRALGINLIRDKGFTDYELD